MAYVFEHRGVKFRVQGSFRPLKWINKLGITIGRNIFLSPTYSQISSTLLAHEFCHVLQWRDLGTLRFLWQYFTLMMKHGYGLAHPMEKEAYDFAVANYAEFVPYVQAMGALG